MLRLSDAHRPLWRTETTVQLGIERPVRLDAVTPWQEELLAALWRGVDESLLRPLALALGATPADAEAFLDRIRPVLIPDEGRCAVHIDLPAETRKSDADGVRACLAAVGIDALPPEDTSPAPVLLFAPHLVDPRRAASLMRTDTPHLPVALSRDRVTVGPFIRPGTTACLSCVYAELRAEDPLWPAVAAQLMGRMMPPLPAGILTEAARLCSLLLRERVPAGTSISAGEGDARRTWRHHRPSERCGCRSPAGNGRADGHDDHSSAPTTSTMSSPHA